MTRVRGACYPGSFDPVTLGHLDLIRRGVHLFGRVVVAVGRNAAKAPMFPLEERVGMLQAEVRGLEGVEVRAFQGLAVDLCRREGLQVLIRGVRNVSDFESECQMARTNAGFAPGIETVLLLPAQEHANISSRLIKEVVTSGGSVAGFVPPAVERALARRLRGEDGA